MEETRFEYGSLPALWQHYAQNPRALGYAAQSRQEAEQWQTQLRQQLTQLLGGFAEPLGEIHSYPLEQQQCEGYTRELRVIQVGPNEHMPCYILTPQHISAGPVIALHGHGLAGARPLVGIMLNEDERISSEAQNNGYGLSLVQRGHTVFVPVLRGFAERMEAEPYRENKPMWPSSCRVESVNAMLLGKSLLGLRIWDVKCLIDYIHQQYPESREQALGCVGLSGGAMLAMFSAALDERIACTIVNSYFNTFRDSIMSIEHCLCNYVPGLAHYAEMSDIAGLIAPRPLMIVSGTEDQIFPLHGVVRGMSALRPIYEQFDAGDKLALDLFAGGHQWHGEHSEAWLAQWQKALSTMV